MAKQVKYLVQIVPHLEKKYGREKAGVIMEKARARYAELVAENKDGPKAYYTHTRQRIYPGISMFDAMTGEGISWEEAADFITSYSRWRADGAGFKRQFDPRSYRAFFEEAGYTDVSFDVVEGRMPCAIAGIRRHGV